MLCDGDTLLIVAPDGCARSTGVAIALQLSVAAVSSHPSANLAIAPPRFRF